jgi:Na+/melibiose symporter-like transporter
MGGLASVFVLMGGSFLYRANRNYPFIFTAVLMGIALFLLLKYIKEPVVGETSKEDRINLKSSIHAIAKNHDKSIAYILFAIFFWFIGYQGLEATFSNYCVQFLGLDVSDASFILSFFALAFLVSAIPAGFIGTKLGKKRTILIGLIGDTSVFVLLATIGTIFPFNKIIMRASARWSLCGHHWLRCGIHCYSNFIFYSFFAYNKSKKGILFLNKEVFYENI